METFWCISKPCGLCLTCAKMTIDMFSIKWSSTSLWVTPSILMGSIINLVLHQCLSHDKTEHVLNDWHTETYGCHLFGLAIAQKILCVGYFCLTIFKDFIIVYQKVPPLSNIDQENVCTSCSITSYGFCRTLLKMGNWFQAMYPCLGQGALLHHCGGWLHYEVDQKIGVDVNESLRASNDHWAWSSHTKGAPFFKNLTKPFMISN